MEKKVMKSRTKYCYFLKNTYTSEDYKEFLVEFENIEENIKLLKQGKLSYKEKQKLFETIDSMDFLFNKLKRRLIKSSLKVLHNEEC